MRVKKEVAGRTTTQYIFSGTKVIAEYANGAAVDYVPRKKIDYRSRSTNDDYGAGKPKEQFGSWDLRIASNRKFKRQRYRGSKE